MRRSAPLCAAMVMALFATMLVAGAQGASAGQYTRTAGPDFDCDGVRDAVQADSLDVVSGRDGAGSVTVTYGASGRRHQITQATSGVPGSPEVDDAFGDSYAWYDRDRNGCDDLVIGVPGESIGTKRAAGMVIYIPGSASGLNTAKSAGYTQNSPGYPGKVEAGDAFGDSLAAGTTRQGVPFLLIGAPGEDGPSIWTASSGTVYYVRGSTVKLLHQDTPGVAGKREHDEYFGESLSASDRFFAVGIPGESIGSVRGAGMVQVFSHTLTNGRPTPIGGFHQNTKGISGVAERDDWFGASVSVVSFRSSSSQPIGALVGVGTMAEGVGSADAAGMAHLVYITPSGTVRQRAAVTQRTPGVTGTPEEGDYLGSDVVVANLSASSTVARPSTAAWAVGVNQELHPGGLGGVHVFRPGWKPGDPDIWLREGRLGIGPMSNIDHLRATRTELFWGSHGGSCDSARWSDLLDGGPFEPTYRPYDDCQ